MYLNTNAWNVLMVNIVTLLYCKIVCNKHISVVCVNNINYGFMSVPCSLCSTLNSVNRKNSDMVKNAVTQVRYSL